MQSIPIEIQSGDLQTPDGWFLHNRHSYSNSDCGTFLGSTSATRRYKVCLCHIKTQDFAGFCGGGIGRTLAECYSMADCSPTVTGIPFLIAGGCWAQCQLHTGIRYVPVTSKLRISLASVVGEHR